MSHHIRLFQKGEFPLILLEGEITGEIHNELFEIYYSVDEDARKKRVILDFSKVDYINSSGIAALIEIITSSEKFGGVIECLNPKKQILHILEVIGLTEILKMTYE